MRHKFPRILVGHELDLGSNSDAPHHKYWPPDTAATSNTRAAPPSPRRDPDAMAAAVACRKRSATPFLDEVLPAPPHLPKHGRFSPFPGAAAAQRPPCLAFDPLDALRRVFPDAGPGELEACFAVSGESPCLVLVIE